MALDARLAAAAELCRPGLPVADVGCDHGYLGIYLLREGLAQAVIASDVHQAPLESALHNAVTYGVRDKMRFFLADGVQGLPRDFDTLVCAGMGADTIVSILDGAPWLKNERYRLILQCQSKRPALRRYLSDQGYAIRRETLAQDGKFLYPVMEAAYAPGPALTEAECWVSPALLESGSPLLPAFLTRVAAGVERAAAGLSQSGGEKYETYLSILKQLRQWEERYGNRG